MIITDITTTVLRIPNGTPIQDATIPTPRPGVRSQLFVHIHTDEGHEGLGMAEATPGTRQVIQEALKPILVGKNPLDIEYLWDQMFWHVRGVGR